MPYDGRADLEEVLGSVDLPLRAELLHLLSPSGPLSHDVRQVVGAALSIARQRPETGTLAEWQKAKLCQYVETNLASKLSQASLAAEIRLSISHFAHAFRRSFGCTPHRYVTGRRMERARLLLRSSEQPISGIALSCGLSDQAHLSRLFKQDTGLTPTQWRRRYAEQPTRHHTNA